MSECERQSNHSTAVYMVACAACGEEFGYYPSRKKRKYCSKECSQKRYDTQYAELDPTLAPTKSPSMPDIYWAAGLYEGEGSCGKTYKSKRKSMASVQTKICQKDPEILYRMRDLFGGSVLYRPARNGHNENYDWVLSGARSRGFLMTMYSLMSQRRQGQIDAALGWKVA